MKKLKEILIYILIFIPVSNGFYVPGAKQWVEKVLRVLTKTKNYSLIKKIRAFRVGYTPQLIDKLGIDNSNIEKNISLRDYWYLQPLNGIYTKWMDNKVITRKIFADYDDIFQNVYYQITSSKTGVTVTALEDCPYGSQTPEDILKLIKAKNVLCITEPRRYRNAVVEYVSGSFYFDHEKIDENAVIDRISKFHKRAIIAEYLKPASEYKNNKSDFGNLITAIIINKNGSSPIITEAFMRVDDHYTEDVELLKHEIESCYDTEYTYEHLYSKETVLENKIFYNNDTLEKSDVEKLPEEKYFNGIIVPVDPVSGKYNEGMISSSNRIIEADISFTDRRELKGDVSYWNEIKGAVTRICRHVPQLEFFSIDILITDKGFKLIPFINVPEYMDHKLFSEETTEYLLGKLKEKKTYYRKGSVKWSLSSEKIRMKTRKIFSSIFFPKGLKPYLSVRWISEVVNDFLTNKEASLPEKLWAYRHGFLSYRLKQYGINENNYCDFISDFEYKWLRHINGSYRAIFEDKITVKYIVNKYRECFPDYYFHVKTINNVNVIIPMMDCPDDYDNDFRDIFMLLHEKGVLALKPDEGSHGDGFYKLSYENGEYYLNHKIADKQKVIEILSNPNNQYLITEYINNHPQFKRIYSGSVNTIRMIVFKEDGVTPIIGNAYMRFGSQKTGAVDNMGAGGMFVQIDIDTGKYHSAKIITQNSIKDCPNHPDTGVLIEGIVPHWENVKDTVLKVAESIPQLEYFGFDIAVTEEGIKFPEINRFPDYPKIEKFSSVTNQYLLQKLKEKKHRYGYDVRPCRKLIHLPKR